MGQAAVRYLTFLEQFLFAHEVAVIGGEDDSRVLQQMSSRERLVGAFHLGVTVGDQAVVDSQSLS